MRIVVVLALAACGGAAPPPAKTPTPANQAEPRVRDTPPPWIVWGGNDGHWSLVDLPAVARAGELVVVPIIESDGGRGYPNLRVEVRDRSDKTVQTIRVLTSDEFEKLAPGGQPGPELQQRIGDANRQLASLHGVHDLVPMHALEVQPPAAGGEKHFAIGDGFDVDWNGDHLHVFTHDADRSFLTLDCTPWLPKPRTAGGEPCSNPASLAGVYHARDINVLVVELAFKGTDVCWEPGNALHVVAW